MRKSFALLGACLLLLTGSLGAAAQTLRTEEPPRVIVIKTDGLPPWLLEAAVHPDDDAAVSRLDNPVQWRRAVAHYREMLGRQQLLPNFEHYFFENGVRTDQMYSATVTLSSVAWSVIDSGHHSVVKGHGEFSRDTGHMRSYLDFLRDTLDYTRRRGDKTLGVWVLQQSGVSLTSDAFDPDRIWMAPQMYLRPVLKDYLVDLGLDYIKHGHKFSEPQKILKTQLGRQAGDPRYVEWGEGFMMDQLAQHVLSTDYTGEENYDFLSGFFSEMDHQQHAEPSPEGLLYRLIHFDALVGEVFHAVEHSQRRGRTYVVVISDHGQEWEPGLTAASVPLTRLFRTRLFGGHTIQNLMSEESDRALQVPMRGVDRPRVYGSPFSPYGDDWPTAYVEPFGNARAEIHLRNNDLNRLQLALQAALKGGWSEDQWGVLDTRLRNTLAAIGTWLPQDLEGLRDYADGAADRARFLARSADPFKTDTAARLQAELDRIQPQLAALTRLQGLIEHTRGRSPLSLVLAKGFKIDDYIPKKFYGPRNSFYQLTHYTIGLDQNFNWVEKTVDLRGNPVPVNYFQIMADYKVDNPPVPDELNPFDLMVYAITPPAALEPLLREKNLISTDDSLTDAIWVRSTAQHNPGKGGEALILRRQDGLIKYVPVTAFAEDAAGHYSFGTDATLDPLALLSDPGFLGDLAGDRRAWLGAWHTYREWLDAVCRTRYTDAPLVFLDIAGRNYRRFIHRPEFVNSLVGFSSPELKQDYLRGLDRKYAGYMGDFWVWSTLHYNFSSKGPEPAGAHGGLGWRVARTSFLVWGGEDTGLRRGVVLEQPATTLDIAPTLLCLAGRLEDNNEPDPPDSGVPPRVFPPYPGHVLDVFARPHACDSVRTQRLAAAPANPAASQ